MNPLLETGPSEEFDLYEYLIEDDEDVEFADNSPVKKQVEDPEYAFEVLSKDQVTEYMETLVRRVQSITGLPPVTVRELMSHFKWNEERLVERFYDGDQTALFAEAKIVNPYREPINLLTKTTASDAETCVICLETLPSLIMKRMVCGHVFCSECWTQYLTLKIMDEGLAEELVCASYNCGTSVDRATITASITDSNVQSKYQLLMTNGFVGCNRLLKWCTAPDCDKVIKVQSIEARPVTCACLHTFCYFCGELWHTPVTCQQLKKWIKKTEVDLDAETVKWIVANTRECPECNVSIEKNGGCNHMTCRNRSCKAQFCWMCLGKWENHGNCNVYDAESRRASRTTKQLLEMDRYIFFLNHYTNHKKSLAFQLKLFASLEEKTYAELESHLPDISRAEVKFSQKAVEVLCDCRRTLIHTYVFAFFLKQNNQSVIFEANQSDLESATETLSDYLERKITRYNWKEMRQRVLDQYRYCDTRRKVLLEHVQEGREKGWWSFEE